MKTFVKVLAICAGATVVVAGSCAGCGWYVVKSLERVTEARRVLPEKLAPMLENDRELIAAIGSPITVEPASWFNVQTINGVTHAFIESRVRGPKGDRWVRAAAHATLGSSEWTVTEYEIRARGIFPDDEAARMLEALFSPGE